MQERDGHTHRQTPHNDIGLFYIAQQKTKYNYNQVKTQKNLNKNLTHTKVNLLKLKHCSGRLLRYLLENGSA